MASRRKQSKPKSFGVNELENTATDQTAIKSDELTAPATLPGTSTEVPKAPHLAPVPTDLLSFINASDGVTTNTPPNSIKDSTNLTHSSSSSNSSLPTVEKPTESAETAEIIISNTSVELEDSAELMNESNVELNETTPQANKFTALTNDSNTDAICTRIANKRKRSIDEDMSNMLDVEQSSQVTSRLTECGMNEESIVTGEENDGLGLAIHQQFDVETDYDEAGDEHENDFNLDDEEDDYIEELESTLNEHHQTNRVRQHYTLNANDSNSMYEQSINSQAVNTNQQLSLDNPDSLLLMFKCKVCGKGFKHRRSLNRHVRLHSGEKNYKCPHCTTAFARSDHLKAHIRTHNNSKPYRCAVCQCGYNTQAALKVHIAHHHSKSKFKCVLCNNLEFHSQLALEGHVYTKHSNSGAITADMEAFKADHDMVNTTNDLNENNESNFNMNNNNNDNNNSESSFYTKSDENQHISTSSHNRVKLADINNYSTKEDLNEETSNNSQYLSNNNQSNKIFNNCNENRENLLRTNNNNNNNNSQISNDITIEDNEDLSSEQIGSEVNFYPVDDLNDSLDRSEVNSQNHMMTNGSTETATVIDNYGEDDDEENHSDLSSNSINNTQQQQHHQQRTNGFDKNDDSDDIIIEETKSTQNSPLLNKNESFKRLAPKITIIGSKSNLLPAPPSNNLNNNNINSKPSLLIPPPLLLPGGNTNRNSNIKPINNSIGKSMIPSTISSLNTYCEMCNARFSNVESFQAHMRNCHPNIHIQQQQQQQNSNQNSNQPAKMPYLTSILTKANSSPNLTSNGIVNGNSKPENLGSGIIITNTGIIVTGANPLHTPSKPLSAVCTRPNCNCASSLSPNCGATVTNRPNINSSICGNKPIVAKQPIIEEPNEINVDFYYAIKETHYTCSQCQLTLHKLNDYIAHLKQEHCVEVFRCVLCKQMQLFDNLNLLKEHFFQEHQSHKFEFYRCRLCINPSPNSASSSLLFNSLDDLSSHLKQVHQINAPLPPPSHLNKNESLGMPRSIQPHVMQQQSQNTIAMPPPPPPLPPNVHMHSMHLQQQQQPQPIYPPPIPPSQNINHSQYNHQYNNNYNDRYNGYANTNNNNSNKCFKCNYCESDFAQQSYLNQHIQMVHNKPVQSVNCNQYMPQHPPPPPPQQQHQQQQPPVNIFHCQYCRSTFSNRTMLERHLRIHVSSIDLKCNICDKVFETQELLNQHKPVHNKIFQINEPITQTDPGIKQNGSNASQSTDSSSPAVCVYCKLTIENESMFKEHFKRHNNIGANNQQGCKTNSFICIVCRQTLTSNNEYNLHMRHHLRRQILPPSSTAATTAAVAAAPTAISNSSAVKSQPPKPIDQHESGTNSIPSEKASSDETSKLRCSKCLVKFEVWQELADHIAEMHSIKSNEKKLEQPKEQKQQPAIKQERKSPSLPVENEAKKQAIDSSLSVQSNVVPNSINMNGSTANDLCEICSSKFDSNLKLQCHLLIKHEFANSNGLFTCPVCDEGFSRPENLIQHTYTHGQPARIYKCTECNVAFVFKAQLINHSFSHHQNGKKKLPTDMGNNQLHVQAGYNSNLQPPMAKRIIPANITQMNPSGSHMAYKNMNPNVTMVNNNNNQMNRPRQIIPNTPNYQNPSYQQHHQHQQQQHHSLQRLRCNECNMEFSQFRFYQNHCQQVHNRTIIQSNTNNHLNHHNYLNSSNSSSIIG